MEVARATPSDLRPFEQLVRRHEGEVLASCRHLAGSADDARDLAQEFLVKASRGLREGVKGSS